MAGTIKGITIQLGADTTKLSTALNSANRAIRQTQTELRKVESALKINPTNINLLKDKQVLLNNKIADTKTKLEAMKQAQAKLDAKGVDKNSKEYQKLKTEIDVCEQELKDLNRQAREFGSVGAQMALAVGEKFKDVGEKLTSMGRSLTTSVTLPLVAVGTIGVKKFAEVDKTMQLTNKTMNNTTEEAEQLDQAMKDAASNSTYGMSEAATATLNFARAGLSAEEAASSLAPAMNLAAGEGGNLDTVSAGLVATINGFGGSFDDATKYADVFANACNNSALDVDSLSESMSVAAPIFAAAGYSVEDAALYMGVMANAGIDASTAANALKTGMARLVSPSADAKSWMDKLNISITNADGSMKDSVTVQKELHDAFSGLSESEQIAAASAIFGKNQMSNWLALINTAPSDVDSLSNSLKKEGTTAEMADAMMSGFGGSLEKLKSTADVAATSFGEALAPMISKVADVLQKVTEWFNHLDKSQRETIATVAVVVASIGPLLLIIGKISTGIGAVISIGAKIGPLITTIVGGVKNIIATMAALPTVMTLTGTTGTGMFASLTAAFESFSAAIMANPIGLLIAAIVALVAAIGYAIYYIATEEEAIKSVDQAQADLAEAHNKTVDVMNSYVGAVDSVAESTEALKKAEEEAGQSGEELFNQFNNGTLTYENMTAAQQNVLKAYIDLNSKQKELEEQSQALAEAKNAETVASYENQLAMIAENGSVEDNMQAYEDYKKSVIDAFEKGTISADQARDLIGASMTEMSYDAMVTFVEDIPNDINQGFDPMTYQTTLQRYSSTFSGLWNWTKEGWNSATEYIGEQWDSFKNNFQIVSDAISAKWNEITGWISGVWDGAVSTITGAWNSVSDAVSGVVDKVFDTLGGFWDKAKTWGSDLINGFVDGIKSAWDTLTNTVESVAKAVADFLHFSVPEKGPLADFDESGGDMVKVFAEGVSNNLGLIKSTMADMAEEIADTPLSLDYSGNIGWINQGAMFDEPRQVQYQDNASRDLLGQIMNLMGQYMNAAPVVVNQTINAKETSYAEQQREAAYEFKQIARSLV